MVQEAGISLAVEIAPRRLDLHGPTQQPALAGLLCVVNRVLDDHWIRSLWLRSMKGVHLLVDGRQGFGLGNNLLGFRVTGPGAEQSQRGRADIRPQPFPGLIA